MCEEKYESKEQAELQEEVLEVFWDNVKLFTNEVSKDKWKFISATGCVPDVILREYTDFLDWDILAMTQKFTLDQLRDLEMVINFDVNFMYQNYNEEIYEEFIHIFKAKKFKNFNHQFKYSKEFINKYKRYLNWTELTFHHCKNWDDSFFDDFKDNICFNIVINLRHELRTEVFLTKYCKNIDFQKISVLSTDDLIYKLYRHKLSPDQIAELFLEKMRKYKKSLKPTPEK